MGCDGYAITTFFVNILSVCSLKIKFPIHFCSTNSEKTKFRNL